MQSRAPEDDNDENDIAAVINELANAVTKDKEQMLATFTDLTNTIKTLQGKIEKMDKNGGSKKRNANNENYCWTHGRTRNNNHKSCSYSNKKKDIKVMQLYPIARTDRINGMIVNDNWGTL